MTKPFTLLLLLEIENDLTREDARPAIVDRAYARLIKEYAEGLDEEDRTLLGVMRLLMEQEVMYNLLQVKAIRGMLGHSVTEAWGIANNPDWAALPTDVKMTTILKGLTTESKAKAAAIIRANAKQIGGQRFETNEGVSEDDIVSQLRVNFLKDLAARH